MKQIRAIFSLPTTERRCFVIKSCGLFKDLILLSNAHALRQELSYFLRFCVYVWTDENDSNTLRVDANFFKYREKNSVLKNIQIRVARPNCSFVLAF